MWAQEGNNIRMGKYKLVLLNIECNNCFTQSKVGREDKLENFDLTFSHFLNIEGITNNKLK